MLRFQPFCVRETYGDAKRYHSPLYCRATGCFPGLIIFPFFFLRGVLFAEVQAFMMPRSTNKISIAVLLNLAAFALCALNSTQQQALTVALRSPPRLATCRAVRTDMRKRLGLCTNSNFTCTGGILSGCSSALICDAGDLTAIDFGSIAIKWTPHTIPTEFNLFPTLYTM